MKYLAQALLVLKKTRFDVSLTCFVFYRNQTCILIVL